ncbi:hypothetical protein BRARA_K01501 [Brassica rapa]|uniref:GATA-type domain-containing protein n=1 Tax=Brassica campestris TaxID=3711 RepID=A0A397KYY8_BRACM|nr:hypothetical protein BRARA_K01501 [Brassica rapa]
MFPQLEINPYHIGSTLGEDHVSASAARIPYIDEIANHPDSIYAASGLIPDGSQLLDSPAPEGANQLTVSYRGQVYVFDSVGPEKVDAVLSLLGGSTAAPQGMEIAQQNHHMPVVEHQSRCSHPQRAQSLDRFRKKRSARCFANQVRYGVRQEVALSCCYTSEPLFDIFFNQFELISQALKPRMPRNKGQFSSATTADGAYNSGTDQDNAHDDGRPELSCTHCGVSSTCTPMMRRGPSGPRTLCNACGLFWVSRGTLRDLSKKTEDNQVAMIEPVSILSMCVSEHFALFSLANGDNSNMLGDH